MKNLRGDCLDNRQNQVALIGAGGNVEKRKLVGAFAVVAPRDFDGIAGVAQLDKINTLDDAAGVHVEARNDAFS